MVNTMAVVFGTAALCSGLITMMMVVGLWVWWISGHPLSGELSAALNFGLTYHAILALCSALLILACHLLRFSVVRSRSLEYVPPVGDQRLDRPYQGIPATGSNVGSNASIVPDRSKMRRQYLWRQGFQYFLLSLTAGAGAYFIRIAALLMYGMFKHLAIFDRTYINIILGETGMYLTVIYVCARTVFDLYGNIKSTPYVPPVPRQRAALTVE